MKHFYRISLVLMGYAALVFLFHTFRSKPVVAVQDPATAQVAEDFLTRVYSSDPVYDRMIVARIATLKGLDRYRAQMARAAQKMTSARSQAASAVYSAWNEVIQTNKPVYEALLKKALNAPRGQTLCAICDGYSYVPCVMCKNRNGKCTVCGGTGRGGGDDICAACFGKGKCYLCNGTGKMFCPFCDDGMIKVHWAPPRNFPPLD